MVSQDPWSVSSRRSQLQKWKKGTSYKHVRDLNPGKQGTVAVVESPSGQQAVAKVTTFERNDHLIAVKKWKQNRKTTSLQAEGLIEQRIWNVLNKIVLSKRCPNFVLLWEMRFNNADKEITTFSEVWDTTLHDWYSTGSRLTNLIPERVWQSIFFQICAGLLALHDAGIQHQDLHANNVFIKLLPRTKYEGYWTYIIDGVKYYCPNWYYAVAISDYGRAFSSKYRVRSSFQSVVENGLRDTNEFYDMTRIFDSIKAKTKKHSFFRNIRFTESEKQSKRPLAPIIERLFRHYRKKPHQRMVNIDTYRL